MVSIPECFSESYVEARTKFCAAAAGAGGALRSWFNPNARGPNGEALHLDTARFGAADGEVSGHYHPVAALTVRGRGLRRRCFLTDGRRLILPAFGAYAGGLNALDPAIAQLFPDDYDALVVGRDAVRRLSWRQLRPDAQSVC